MTATAHALIGASLATIIANPYLGIPIAVLSHFIADLIPHWDAGTNHRNKSMTRLKVEAALDVLLGFALVLILFRNFSQTNPIYLFSMVIAAQLPDWIEAPSWMFGFKVPPFSWLDWLGHKLQSRAQLPWGLVTQIVVVGVLLLMTVNFADVGNVLAALIPAS
ncbi:hypothetical protein A3D81_00880 [Candidatus Curtissbacteria bacterium RIFCSPHIGHO2_02_FULL_40_17]|uniref:Uncharacterized protein n=3 Tax=Candidatus Curtissiibacteriota TaxID=1752717 RepID=A0A1F5GK60_9BACT|nr:MAG: hypothetical protein A3D81_00880 [Candidatus Curtissbacteria bacterium RIFCSPHIGHO2_02_FULL_40_17]OGE03935.1 MAG: hypothetical protein A3F45_04655 [Candidatus Curtissbacteria bacterium RIFCSPHIGHO2_12_FULL_41_17]OGE07054.1 MAG: hypothetical protein A3I53_03245 [Candidatus Curtissbacteria bacterium RIFCSPLOWO2_02_FULL_40_13b]